MEKASFQMNKLSLIDDPKESDQSTKVVPSSELSIDDSTHLQS